MSARALWLLVIVLGCAEKQARPEPHLRLVEAVGDGQGDGVLVYVRESMSEGNSVHLVRQTAEGRILWHASQAGDRDADGVQPYGFGESLVLGVVARPALPPGSLLHVRRASGATQTWPSPLARVAETIVVGDDRQVFVVRRGDVDGDLPEPLAIAGYDLDTGERRWSVVDEVEPGYSRVRLDERWLLVGGTGSDWWALGRDDGQRAEFPVLDAPGLCRAHGRWWGRRDDTLVALDLRETRPTHEETLAEFVEADYRHQWSLIDCAEHGDEVVLRVNVEPYRTGMLVGVDAGTLEIRWKLALPYSFHAIGDPRSARAWPARLGDTALVAQIEEFARYTCAIDLVGKQVRWCSEWSEDRPGTTHDLWVATRAYADGDDWIVARPRALADDEHDMYFFRVRGSDAEVEAAAAVRALVLPGRDGREHVMDGKIWVHGPDPDPSRMHELPLVVLDARTLRPVAPRAFGQERMIAGVRDAMAEVDAVFVRTSELPPARGQGVWTVRHPEDPWDDLIRGHGPEGPPAEPDVEHHQKVFAAARVEAGLPDDTAIRVLAHRGRFVVGYAGHVHPDGPRWTLIKGHGEESRNVAARTFRRRPTEYDLHVFLQDQEPAYAPDSRAGVVDEAAWQGLTGSARTRRIWMVQ